MRKDGIRFLAVPFVGDLGGYFEIPKVVSCSIASDSILSLHENIYIYTLKKSGTDDM